MARLGSSPQRWRIAAVTLGSGLCAVAAGALLLGLGCAPWTGLSRLADAGGYRSGGSLDAAVADAAGVLAWLLVGWLTGSAVLAAVGALPHRVGRTAQRLSTLVTPLLVRRAVAAVIGGSALVAGGAAGPAQAAGPLPDLDRPASQASQVVSPVDPQDPVATGRVVVRPGDSLWRLAARELPAGAGPARITTRWQLWYAANRGVVGADPDLLRPGQVLRPPGDAPA